MNHSDPPPSPGVVRRAGPVPAGPAAVVPIPDLRDYHLINAALVQHLDAGARHVRLQGAEGQRLLVSGLSGAWEALVEVEGRAGPELAAGLDAPGLTVVCTGPAADGAARGLRAGVVAILGDAGAAVGYAQLGGAVVCAASAGPRAGLNLAGGDLVLLGPVGALCGERQAGGRVFVVEGRVGPHAGHARRGGRMLTVRPDGSDHLGLSDPDHAAWLAWLGRAGLEWVGPAPA